MPDSPLPGVSSTLLYLLAKLAWKAAPDHNDAKGIPLGAFESTALYFARGELWASGPLKPSAPALGPFLCSEGTAQVLQSGELARDGAIAFNGKRYRIAALTENGQLIARAELDPLPPSPG